MVVQSYWPNSQNWGRFWPTGIMATIAIIQLLVSFIVLGIHIAIVLIGTLGFCFGATTWYIMGFVCWVFFFACWISVFSVTCCNRSSPGCATYTLVKNILAFVFACVLIDFDRKFIDGEYLVYMYTGYTGNCNGFSSSYNWGETRTSLTNITLSLTKGQLAGAVVILVLALIYVGLYFYVYIIAVTANSIPRDFAHQPMSFPPYQPAVVGGFRAAPYDPHSPTIACPKCGYPVDLPTRL